LRLNVRSLAERLPSLVCEIRAPCDAVPVMSTGLTNESPIAVGAPDDIVAIPEILQSFSE
jgi:hypothetical protein